MASTQVKSFYDQHGGLAVFSLPLTEVITEGQLQVQYFERARFELRADGIALTRIGSALTEGRTDVAFTWRATAPAADRTFYPASGHSPGGAFGWFWQTHDGLTLFGYPISEEFTEDG
jgi:hypothetical protein